MHDTGAGQGKAGIAGYLAAAYKDVVVLGPDGVKSQSGKGFRDEVEEACEHLVRPGIGSDIGQHDIAHVGIDAAASALAPHHIDAVCTAIIQIDFIFHDLIAPEYHSRRDLPEKEHILLSRMRQVFFHRQIERQATDLLRGQDDMRHAYVFSILHTREYLKIVSCHRSAATRANIIREPKRFCYICAKLYSMLRLSAILAAALIALSTVPAVSAQEYSFQDGENLKYSVHYKWGMIDADVANAALALTHEEIDGVPVYHASLGGRTQKMYKKLFTVVETVDSWFARKDLHQIKCERHSREGSYWLNSTTLYRNGSGGLTAEAEIETSRKGRFERKASIDDSTFDVAAMLFRMRNIDIAGLEVGKAMPLRFIMDGKVYNLHYTYLGREVRKVGDLGKIKCLKVGFEVVKGETFSGDSDLYCWFSDDDNRIPVCFTAPLKIGKVKGRLTGYSGLRHDFAAKATDK